MMRVVMSTHEQRMAAAPAFSVKQVHDLVRDLAAPRPVVYWVDMTASAAAGWASVAALALFPLGWWSVPVLVVGVLAMYRAVVFLHEIIHLRRRRGFTAFRWGWNLLVGLPLLIPSFLYEIHAEHHSKRLYGTAADGEYVAFARLGRRQILTVVATTPLLPLLGPWRFGVLAPLSWFVPRLRDYVWTRASALTLDLEYRGRPPRPGSQRRSWIWQEAAATVVCWAAVVAVVVGVMPWQVPLAWAAVLLGAMSIDAVRVLGAHRYIGNDDTMTVVEQMLDTINYDRARWAAELWGPVGLRLHALHHLMPALPYHALPEAHRRLVSALPPDSAYRLTESPGLLASLADLWRVAGRGGPTTPAPGVAASTGVAGGVDLMGAPASGS
jgi:fatty acid desaturase